MYIHTIYPSVHDLSLVSVSLLMCLLRVRILGEGVCVSSLIYEVREEEEENLRIFVLLFLLQWIKKMVSP